MTWYAQRGEDEKLADLLGDSRPFFWIDVGAWHPTHDSVTRHFYDAGGRGINVEPNPEFFQLLRAERPRDINLPFAVSNREGVAAFAILPGTGLSTLSHHVSATWEVPAQTLAVHTVRLADICRAHVPLDLPIDFLKIDVEGHEAQVLEGGEWTRFRPRFLVIEATEPGTDVPAWDAWEPFVLQRGYSFLEFDGLNRFYRSAES